MGNLVSLVRSFFITLNFNFVGAQNYTIFAPAYTLYR